MCLFVCVFVCACVRRFYTCVCVPMHVFAPVFMCSCVCVCVCVCMHHVTNEEVRAEIQQAIGPHEDLLTIIKRRKLQWYGHVSRPSGLAKTILQGTVKGRRRQS